MDTQQLTVYITTWCGDCRRIIAYLDSQGVAYKAVNIDKDPESARLVRQLNHGFRSVPTLLFPNGLQLVEPSIEQLQSALDQAEV